MSGYFDDFNPKEWEDFCEIMIRYEYGAKYFWNVPDEDCGDLGIEFYTITGILFQCYYPDKEVSMPEYKKKIQNKINNDLNKLKKNELKIVKMIDDVEINQWVLLTPEFKSKDLIAYCNKKKKEVISRNISYIDNDNFTVNIETANTYPNAKLYAMGVFNKPVNIPMTKVTAADKVAWELGNSKFSSNINRKSSSLMGDKNNDFQEKVVVKYIQLEKFLDQLRTEYPDLYELIQDSAIAQLETMQEDSVLESTLDKDFIKIILNNNKNAFSKYSKFMSDKNMQSLSFGYISKWLAECYMDFNK